MTETAFNVTYASLLDPPEALHGCFEAGLGRVRSTLGREYAMFIGGRDRASREKFEDRSPADTGVVLGLFQKGVEDDVRDAVAAARKAFRSWRAVPWPERVACLRRVAALIEERTFDIAAALALEMGKNRMETLGDVVESSVLLRHSCDRMEQNDGFVTRMGTDPVPGVTTTNLSVLRPHGVWAVVAPFNYPPSLTCGPAGAALAAGNTVVVKPSTEAPWAVRLLVDCFRDAGLPEGAINLVTGPGETVGRTLVESPDVDGITFTGSHEVGMDIYRRFAAGRYARPVILELGGKNPTIVSRHADPARAALGIARSAFGLQGQRCSACSRAYIEEPLFEEVAERTAEIARGFTVGDPTARGVHLGPVINRGAQNKFREFSSDLARSGRILTGGRVLEDGALARGYFCEPTVSANVPFDHRLWRDEMFLPIVMLAPVSNLDEAMTRANDSVYGLTAGFYGTTEEARWFFANIEAGVSFANRLHGSTTGAWPGLQPFGGWKGSGASGKNSGGNYYLQLYLREQIQSLVE